MARSRTSPAGQLAPISASSLAIENGLTLGAATIASAIAIRFDAFERFVRLSRRFEHQQLDELAVTTALFLVACSILLMRRERQLLARLRSSEARERQLLARLRSSEARERAAHVAAREDALTGLANRLAFTEALDRASARGEPFSLLVIDLDGFKSLNDRLGHAAGDDALCHVGGRLRLIATKFGAICAARTGGDEFGLIVPARTEVGEVAARIIAELSHPFICDGSSAQLSASIGVARQPGGTSASGSALRRADLAMYRAKRAGGSGWCHDEVPPEFEHERMFAIPRLADG